MICSDVLHYVSEAELRAGIPVLAEAIEGIAFIEVLTREDEIVGDLEGLIRRPAQWYRNLFGRAGMTAVGPYCWLPPVMRDAVAELEKK